MKLLTVKETARILAVSERTLYQWHWQGKKFPFIKVGRALRVSETGLAKFIKSGVSKSENKTRK